MEAKSVRTKNRLGQDRDVEVIREALKTDGNRFVFYPEKPEDGLSVTIVWGAGGGEEEEESPQNQQKEQGKGQKDQDKGQKGKQGNQEDGKGKEGEEGDSGSDGGQQGEGGEDGDEDSRSGNTGKGSGKGNQQDKRDGDSEGEGGSEDSEDSGKDREGGKQGQGRERSGKGKESGEGGKGGKEGDEDEGDGESVEGEGEKGEPGGDQEGEEGGGEEGEREGKGQGQEKGEGESGDEDSDSSGTGGQGKSPNDMDMDIDDILGGGGSNDNDDDGEDEDGENGDYEDDRKKGKDKEKDNDKGKEKGKRGKGEREKDGGKKKQPEDDNEMEGETSDIDEFPPSGEPDPKVLDVVFGKTRQVDEQENKFIHRSFVFSAKGNQIQVFKIEYKGSRGSGDRTYIKKLANLVYWLYEPYLKSSSTDLDPSEPVISSPISPQGLRSPRAHERPIISYGAISRVERVDFNKLIVFIDVSGSMDMNVVGRAVNSYFYSVFSGLKKSASQVVKVLVVMHGTNAGVFGLSSSWRNAGGIIAKVAESSRNIVGTGNGSESTLTHRIVDILKTTNPVPGANISSFILGQVPIIWITDFLWSVSVSPQFTNFLKNKPALLISTLGDPGERGDESVFGDLGHETALTILRRVPYGALVYFPSFAGLSSGTFDPEQAPSSSSSPARVYAKGQAYEQLSNRRDKIGNVTLISVR